MSFNFFILFWGLDKKNRITFFEPFNNPILVKMSSIFLQGSVSLQDWSKWNVYFVARQMLTFDYLPSCWWLRWLTGSKLLWVYNPATR